MRLPLLLSLLQTVFTKKCYELQSGAHVENKEDVALNACLPRKLSGGALNCDHCTHAGSFTSCYLLDSRCSPVGEKRPDAKAQFCFPQDSAKVENWGYGPVDLGQPVTIGQENVWMQNFDLKGNFKVVDSVCIDHYCSPCFLQHSGARPRIATVLMPVASFALTAVVPLWL